jgi:hypothetical protein
LSELEEIITRCVLQKSKVCETVCMPASARLYAPRERMRGRKMDVPLLSRLTWCLISRDSLAFHTRDSLPCKTPHTVCLTRMHTHSHTHTHTHTHTHRLRKTTCLSRRTCFSRSFCVATFKGALDSYISSELQSVEYMHVQHKAVQYTFYLRVCVVGWKEETWGVCAHVYAHSSEPSETSNNSDKSATACESSEIGNNAE